MTIYVWLNSKFYSRIQTQPDVDMLRLVMLSYCGRLTKQSDTYTYTHGQTALYTAVLFPFAPRNCIYFLFSLDTAGFYAAVWCIINPYTYTRGRIGLIPSLTNFLLQYHSNPAPLSCAAASITRWRHFFPAMPSALSACQGWQQLLFERTSIILLPLLQWSTCVCQAWLLGGFPV